MITKAMYGEKADIALGMWVKLARAYSTFARLSARDIEQYGLTPPQFSVMETLGHLGPVTMGDLGKKMLVTGGCVTVIIDNLETDGLVERVRDPRDRRIVRVRLTEKGEKMFRRMFPSHAERIAGYASVLSRREQEQLSVLLKKLGRTLQESQATEGPASQTNARIEP